MLQSINLHFAQSWILEKSFQTELISNWHDAFEIVEEEAVPTLANVIRPHVMYNMKTEKDFEGQNSAPRKTLYGKDRIRKVPSTAQFDIIRILLKVVTILGFRLGVADIKVHTCRVDLSSALSMSGHPKSGADRESFYGS